MSGEGIKFRRSLYFTLTFVFTIWMVKIVEHTFDFDFGVFGILPRTLKGSLGIITAPLIHGDVFHLISNTFPILVLGIGMFYFYDRIAWVVFILIYLMTGFWVWVAARDAYHIGASGIVYGLLSFLLFSGFFRKDSKTLAISFAVLFLYGTTLFSGVIPHAGPVSWESHLMGAIAGIFCAIYFKNEHRASIENKNTDLNTVYRYHYLPKEQSTPEKKPNHYDIIYTPDDQEDQ